MTPDWLADPDLPFVLALFVAVLVAWFLTALTLARASRRYEAPPVCARCDAWDRHVTEALGLFEQDDETPLADQAAEWLRARSW